MNDLFSSGPKPAPAQQDDYDAKSIEVLEGLEPVRKRPGMYIGGTDSNSVHHLVNEVLDNAMDEAVAGHADRITLHMHADGTVSIDDNGRGIPVDAHPKFPGKSALEVILTTLHAGGKFSDKNYATAGGLHGVGISVVNALSDALRVEVARNRQLYAQEFKQGAPTGPLVTLGAVANRRGTRVTFHPDTEIFKDFEGFSPQRLFKLARSKAYLFSGVEIRWSADPEVLRHADDIPERARFHFPAGLRDYIQDRVTPESRLVPEIFAGSEALDARQKINWAVCWVCGAGSSFQSYCNTIATPHGGSHENAFRLGMLKALRNYGELAGSKKASQIAAEDIFENTVVLVSAFIQDPQFQGQTKEKLMSPTIGRPIETLLKDQFDVWLAHHSADAQVILEKALQNTEQRLRRKQDRDTARQTVTKRLQLPAKLVDCTTKEREKSELFIVEGNSAGGSAKSARTRETQAILPLRGKILNVASASEDKLLANQEIRDLVRVLGCGVGKKCDMQKLRYGRVIIMTDADVDGAHIASLLLTFFYQQIRPLMATGRIYLALPPLYRLASKSQVLYAHDDAEKDHLLKKVFKGNQKVDISRFKGLGEMDWRHLKETTMDPTSRTLLRVQMPERASFGRPERDTISMERFIDELMGRKSDKRYQFIKDNAQFVESIDA